MQNAKRNNLHSAFSCAHADDELTNKIYFFLPQTRIMRKLAFCVVLSFLFVQCRNAHAAPYVVHTPAAQNSSAEATFALCLNREPSAELRVSLRFCRELSYAYCVNSSLVGSLLRVESDVVDHFTNALATPTYANIEHLTWVLDAALELLHESFTELNDDPRCAYAWTGWMCSSVFQRAHNASTKSVDVLLPVDACYDVCTRAEYACDAEFECAQGNLVRTATASPRDRTKAPAAACTNYYNDSVSCSAFEQRHATRLDNFLAQTQNAIPDRDIDDNDEGSDEEGDDPYHHHHRYHSTALRTLRVHSALQLFAFLILIFICIDAVGRVC